ncbi:MAG: hypothetical protein K2X27_28150 [Candidatus Obscuribacterales bacterium]|nr:hypothetical protein [Candidatus Obscuribacterales bacterium]
MEILLILIVIALIFSQSSDRGTRESGEQIMAGIGVGFLIMLGLAALAVGFAFAPTLTCWLLALAGLGLLTLFVRWIYRSYFSPEARLAACRTNMHNRYYDLSLHVVYMERGNYADCLSWAKAKAEKLRIRYKNILREYQKAPEERFETFYEEQLTKFETRIEAVLNGSKPEAKN